MCITAVNERKIEVRVMDECIVITAKTLKPTLEDTLFRIKQLSERKQQIMR
ncbi:hypothetical protein GJV06_10675 [Enterobacteriaceae bacterium RIT691]|nr:hypothetical protein [Enterobacteriaceae bacterium RIT691]